MPRQNRVDPFGHIVAHPARGLLMGNRGCLHDHAGRIVRTSTRDAWISCLPRWPGVRRPLMQPGHYTELFFLDEATAMAAGHRPCGSCRPEALAAFKAAWQRAFGLAHLPRVAAIDHVLRSCMPCQPSATEGLPDGAMVALSHEQPFLRWQGGWSAWTMSGYETRDSCPPPFTSVLTPKPFIEILRAGYRPQVHPSSIEPVTPPTTPVIGTAQP